ncbi:hypothetical protein AB0395_21970 [Streptosporangium sp. NPDC051023]|uniref:hypothetical protein n=1 Tax=Streptosporangium sp. NPDC051023 TaxID=3155410 RepID=UPI00344D53FD
MTDLTTAPAAPRPLAMIAALGYCADGAPVTLTVTVADVTPRTTATGAPWAEVTVTDGLHAMPVTVPAEVYADMRERLEVGRHLAFTGPVSHRGILPSLTATTLILPNQPHTVAIADWPAVAAAAPVVAIAGLSGRSADGRVTVAGTVAALQTYNAATPHVWHRLTLADGNGQRLAVMLYPRLNSLLRAALNGGRATPGRTVRLTGRIARMAGATALIGEVFHQEPVRRWVDVGEWMARREGGQ